MAFGQSIIPNVMEGNNNFTSSLTLLGVSTLDVNVCLTRSYDLVVGTFNVFWDLFQVLFSGFILGLEGWGVQVRVGFLSMF